MTNYKYATPYWKNQHIDYGEGIKAFTSTLIYLLNPNDRRAYVEVYFYDLKGVEYLDMRFGPEDELLVAQGAVYDMRVVDLITDIAKKSELRDGWVKFISNVPLLISGKIVKGYINSKGLLTEEIWSIPFSQYEELIDPDGTEGNNAAKKYEKPDTSHVVIGNRRRIPPKPFPR